MRILVLVAVAALLSGGPAAAQSASQLHDTSSVEANGHRIIQLSLEIPAPPSEVWTALTTSEGWRRLGVGFASVDFRTGGIIETGYAADLVVFDADTVIDTATYDDPRQYPAGIPWVLVNGAIAIENGRATGALAGEAVP